MKTKHLLFVIGLIFSSIIVKGQDKYEYLAIVYSTRYDELTVSIDGQQLIREEIKLEKGDKTNLNVNPILKKISEYQDQNWELVNLTSSSAGANSSVFEVYFAYLRKKKPDKK
jgi:hypothetical protein